MLLGRARELEKLTHHLRGRGRIVVIGEAGVGKTTLVRAAASDHDSVYEGGALATLDWYPYFALSRALGRKPDDADPAAVAASVGAEVRDGLLILDDLHWADAETLKVLPLLARETKLLCTIRLGDPGSDRALAAVRGAGCAVVRLTGLSASAAASVVCNMNPELGEEDVERICRAGRGNPLLLAELARDERPISLAVSVRAQLARQVATAQDSFARLALLARPASASLVGSKADLTPLVEAGLVVRDASRKYGLRHALFGEAALDGLSPDRRRRLHSSLAARLKRPGEAARHYLAAGELAKAEAAALNAAEAARTPGERARHLGIAALAASGPDAAALQLRAAEALTSVTEPRFALEVLARLTTKDQLLRAEGHLYRGRALWTIGDGDGFRRELEAGARLASGSGSAVEVRLAIERVELPLWEWDPPEALERARRAVELARAAGVEEPRARCMVAQAHFIAGRFDKAIRLARSARRVAFAEGDARTELWASGIVTGGHTNAGRRRAARQELLRTARRARELSVRLGEPLGILGHMEFQEYGPSHQLVAQLKERLSDPAPVINRATLYADLILALAELGAADEAEELLEPGQFTIRTRWEQHLLDAAHADALWLDGRPRKALALFGRIPTSTGFDEWLAAAAGWAEADLGLPPSRSTAEPIIPVPGAPETTRALRALVAGEHGAAERLFDEAALAWNERRMALRCRWGEGEAARRAGAVARARQDLRRLEEELEAAGMLPLLARARRSLRLAGVRRGAASLGTATITGREREILDLVGAGLTSRDIARRLALSHRTVDSHIASARRKLGARNRPHAVALARVEP